jgi:hypothetical protein
MSTDRKVADLFRQHKRILQTIGRWLEPPENGAAEMCSNRADPDRPPCDLVRITYLRHRPATTPMPPDGKEKVRWRDPCSARVALHVMIPAAIGEP